MACRRGLRAAALLSRSHRLYVAPEFLTFGASLTFWIIITAISGAVVALIARAMLRASDTVLPDATDFDLKVYRDQLAEVERDVARGVLASEDAERTRTEISRRILSLDAARNAAIGEGAKPSGILIALLAVVMVCGSLALYLWQGAPGYGDLALQNRIAIAQELRENRPTQQAALDSMPPFALPQELDPDFISLLEQLRETVAARPDDLQGHTLLAQTEARVGNMTAAAKAQQTVLRLKGDGATATDMADYGELLVLSVAGYVSPEAEIAFRRALSVDEADGRSRYYLGLMMAQTGRPDTAFRLWDALLRRGPPEAPWIEPILAQIPSISQLAGVNYSIPAIGAGDAPGPSSEDLEAAAEMSPEERMEMIGGMVEGLSNRLATEGGPPQDWARLITSLAIMGNPDQALAVFNNAVEVFAEDPTAMDTIRRAGSQAGVAE